MKYEKWSLGYWCLKQYIRLADWFIYKRIIVIGKEKIPKNKPILFAPNHQNALSDPMAILLNTRFQPVWLARADIFQKSGAINKILRFLKIMPVYRLIDGKENLDKNEETFSASIKVLEHNFALALFPEAAHSRKRQMLTHKKAVPRIVFMAEEKTNFSLDIQIIPAGIYYSHYWKFNSTLIVNFGDPIPVKNYLDLYKTNQNAATVSLRQDIYEAIIPLVIDIRSKDHYDDFERIREIYGNYFLKRQHRKLSVLNLFKSDQKLCHKLDEAEKNNPVEIESVSNLTGDLAEKIRKLKIRSWLLDENQNKVLKFVLNFIYLLISIPVFVYGATLNALPFFLINSLIRKKVKDSSFWSSFFLVAGIILFPLTYIIELLVFGWLIPGIWLKLFFVLSLPFIGKLSFNWYILFRKTIGRWRMLNLKWFNKSEYKKLMNEKEKLFKQLDNLITI